ncbi:response regulator transcription factor [Bacillus sp. DNRA2]|uniref:response regulator transcription factor n=1 Tax=Bacillus sp. DNRA2 TaxID=2723053 RepID=UPI00145CE18B|nr:response regulator transcription factor [Bacillus sp. DNRA2]NMD71439.1 response regulator transcription factor [Bacillus sp. DNRA2]
MEEPIKVVIIDNHPFTTEAIAHFFENEEVGIQVVGKITDGTRTISMINETRPDVVVMEPYLTNINGIDLAQEIIETYNDKIKIVVFASHACEELTRILYKIGVHAVVLKVEPFKTLINAVKQSYLGNILLSNRTLLKDHHHQLTMTEIEILQLISQERKNHEIAKQLSMSKRTVEYHITSIFQKLDVDSRVGAIMKGTQKGLIYI